MVSSSAGWKTYVIISSGLVLILLYIIATSSLKRNGILKASKKLYGYCPKTLFKLNKSVYDECAKRKFILNKEELVQVKRFGWSSPIVVQKYKLVFFQIEKVGCTQWKRLFQLIQNIKRPYNSDVHNPRVNGLRYLRNYKDETIRRIMMDPTWTKATIVREPRARVLSAYFHFYNTKYYKRHISRKKPSFPEFLQYISNHSNVHWSSQIRMPIWLYHNVMIGKLKYIQEFGIKLLKKIGAWDEWGSKWGPSKNETIFGNVYKKEKRSRATEKLQMYYTYELEDIVFNLYSPEYELFNFSCAYISEK